MRLGDIYVLYYKDSKGIRRCQGEKRREPRPGLLPGLRPDPSPHQVRGKLFGWVPAPGRPEKVWLYFRHDCVYNGNLNLWGIKKWSPREIRRYALQASGARRISWTPK